jgi:hypothetical protein
MKIRKFSIFNESISNEEILDCFIDYSDEGSVTITDGWIDGDKFIEKKEHFGKHDLNKTRRAKLVKIKIGEYEGGIHIDHNFYESSMPLTIMNDVIKSLSELKRFHDLTDQEITFSIANRSDKIYLSIIIPLEFVKEEELNLDVVNDFLKEIKLALDKTSLLGKKRKKLSSNWLEMKFRDWRDCLSWGNEILKMNNGNCRFSDLNEIGDRIVKAGWKVYIDGGDTQVIIRLKKS